MIGDISMIQMIGPIQYDDPYIVACFALSIMYMCALGFMLSKYNG